jgi:YwiC-like protein
VSFFHAPGIDFRQYSLKTDSPLLPKTDESCTEKARHERRHALILPREHGAWGLLLVPMVTGAGVAFHHASQIFPLILLLTAALALFWLRTPLESLLGTSVMRAQTLEESHTLRSAVVLLAGIAGLSLAALLWAGRNADLWPLGAVVAVAFIAQAILKKLSRRLRMSSEMIGVIGLTASAPAAYYVITGKFTATAWMLWLANILFAGDQIHYVQLRIHTAKIQGFRARLAHGWAFALGQALMTAIITVACMDRLIPPIASLAFAPLLFRGWFYFIQEPTQLIVRRLGWSELKHATAFCVLLIATFILAR